MRRRFILIGYMIDKEVLFIFGIPIYLTVVGITVFLKKRKGKEVVFIRELLKFGFALYILALIGVTLFPLEIRFGGETIPAFSQAINYMPLRSIIKDVAEVGHGHFSTAFQIKLILRNVGGNFILLLPIGFLLPILFRNINSFRKILIIGFLFSLSIEILQFFENFFRIAFPRIVDVDDLILNTLGTAVGYTLYIFSSFTITKYKENHRKQYS